MVALRDTASAENDLIEAWLFITQDNPDAADRVVDIINLTRGNCLPIYTSGAYARSWHRSRVRD